MRKVGKNTDIRVWKGDIQVYYLYTAGVAGEKFFQSLKEGKLIASRCPDCGKRYIPPRIYCEECLSDVQDYFEVPKSGIVESWSEVYLTADEELLEKPILIALVRIDETDGKLILKALEKVNIGDSVEIILEERRVGSMKDIKGVKRKVLQKR